MNPTQLCALLRAIRPRRRIRAALLIVVAASVIATTHGAALAGARALAERCGDANSDGSITATDSLLALRSAVGSASCDHCRCDVSGRDGVFASDALGILNLAVALPVALDCPSCIDGQACTDATDCNSTFCDAGTCADPCPTQPAGTSCADDGNACTVDECDGSTCQHVPAANGTVCRFASGPCDAPEACDGSGAPCPDDRLLSGVLCRPIQGGCDEAELCDGVSIDCPADEFVSGGTTCRAAIGVCDAVETCSGTSASCPADAFLGNETVCRAAKGVCDAAETCTGTTTSCPEDALLQSDTVCRAPGPGNPADFCDGIGVDCPPDVVTTTTSSTTTTTIMVGCFIDRGDGTIYDDCTGLQWEKKANGAGVHDVGGRFSWAGCCDGDCSSPDKLCQPNDDAANACAEGSEVDFVGCSVCASGTCDVDPNGLGASTTVWDWLAQVNSERLAGFNDWRLPSQRLGTATVGELETILHDPYPSDCAAPCLNEIFGPTALWAYWTSSSAASGQAWYVIFESGANGGGFVGTTVKPTAFAVRAVRTADCMPRTLCVQGECGLVDDGCGGQLDCGPSLDFCRADECGIVGRICPGNIDCGACFGDPCGPASLCNWKYECASDGTCRQKLRDTCFTDDECASGFCECRGERLEDESGTICDVLAGSCRIPTGGPCTEDSECFFEGLDGLDARGACDPETKVCRKKVLRLGQRCSPVCETDPSAIYPFPQGCPGGVWVDEACKTFDASTRAGILGLPIEETYCFKNAVDPGGTCGPWSCLSDSDCAAPDTCLPNGRCGCQSVEDCDAPPNTLFSCEAGSCRLTCTSNEDCAAPTTVCDAGDCRAPCTSDVDCPAPAQCQRGGTCGDSRGESCLADVDCFGDAQCQRGPLNPGNPVCCLGLGQACQDDADCCKGNHLEPNNRTLCPGLADGTPCAGRAGEILGYCQSGVCVATAPFRTRACLDDGPGTPKTCRKKALVGEACSKDDDCLTEFGVTCQGTCSGGFGSCVLDSQCLPPQTCTGPTQCALPYTPRAVPEGGVCIPGSLDFACGEGLTCSDCTYADKGFRCLGPEGCCRNGGVDPVLCGSFESGKQCCGWKCTDLEDPQHCGFCGNDCTKTPLPGYAGCFTPAECKPRGDGLRPLCAYEPQCPAGKQCVPADITIVADHCFPAPNGQGSICCVEPVSPSIYYDFPSGEPEGMFRPIESKGVGAKCIVEGPEGCPHDDLTCEFSCSRTDRYVGGCWTGVCIDRAPTTTTTTTTMPPCRPEFAQCTYSLECCNFGRGAFCSEVGVCTDPFN